VRASACLCDDVGADVTCHGAAWRMRETCDGSHVHATGCVMAVCCIASQLCKLACECVCVCVVLLGSCVWCVRRRTKLAVGQGPGTMHLLHCCRRPRGCQHTRRQLLSALAVHACLPQRRSVACGAACVSSLFARRQAAGNLLAATWRPRVARATQATPSQAASTRPTTRATLRAARQASGRPVDEGGHGGHGLCW
jgi:hypothetical protein